MSVEESFFLSPAIDEGLPCLPSYLEVKLN